MNTHVRDNLRFIKGLDGTSVFDVGANFTGTAHMILVNRVTSANLPATATGGMAYHTTLNNFMFAEVQAGGVKWLSRRDITVMTATSMATGDIFYASGPTSIARLAAGASGSVLQANGAAAPSWGVNAGGIQLLGSGSGVYTAVASATLDSVSITDLVANDRLFILSQGNGDEGSATNLYIRYSTASDKIAVWGGVISSGTYVFGQTYISKIQPTTAANPTAVAAVTQHESTMAGSGSGAVSMYFNTTGTLSSAWTGTWTLSLETTGLGAGGGSLRWSWQIYKVKSS